MCDIPIFLFGNNPAKFECTMELLDMTKCSTLMNIWVIAGIEAWTFEQSLGDAVFIPAGCPHQVRNLKVN